MILLLFLIGVAHGQTLDLPEWDDEDLEALESGEWMPGSNLLGRIAKQLLESDNDDPIELDPAIRDLPEEAEEPIEWSIRIEEKFVRSYFHEPSIGFLNDPQHLLTTQEFRDRGEFLNYHARDTDIDLYVYLFDGLQEIPPGESIGGVVRSHIDGERPAAVVFYFLGMPEKAQLAFTDQITGSVNKEEREKVLRMAVEEALEKSDPSSQLESFSIQLSIRLYWLEKVVAKGGGNISSVRPLIFSRQQDAARKKKGVWAKLKEEPGIFYSVVILAVAAAAIALGLLGRWLTERKRVYVFPDAEGAPLLEAPYAAGVGGVISFSSATAPPSSQKSEVQDYLQRM
jgi:hypothetical protein